MLWPNFGPKKRTSGPCPPAQHAGKPFYLFESTVLRSLGTLLLGRITREDANNIPQVKQSTYFPYREVSGTQNFSQIEYFR